MRRPEKLSRSCPMENWRGILRNGEWIYERGNDRETLVIESHPQADAWVCKLGNGKRLIGELHDVMQAANRYLGGSVSTTRPG